MGAFLAALGAVLLFVLKAVGILLLVVLVLVVLLLLCPFCADLCWEHGVLTVRAGALGITFPVFQYPKPEPPPAPSKVTISTCALEASRRTCSRSSGSKPAILKYTLVMPMSRSCAMRPIR